MYHQLETNDTNQTETKTKKIIFKSKANAIEIGLKSNVLLTISYKNNNNNRTAHNGTKQKSDQI